MRDVPPLVSYLLEQRNIAQIVHVLIIINNKVIESFDKFFLQLFPIVKNIIVRIDIKKKGSKNPTKHQIFWCS